MKVLTPRTGLGPGIIGALAVASGCADHRDKQPADAPQYGELSGEVFIVTQGGPSIKLGLVTVVAIPESEINKHIQERQLAARAFARGQEPKIAAAEKAVSDAQDALVAAQTARPKSDSDGDTAYLACLQTSATRGECRDKRNSQRLSELRSIVAQIEQRKFVLKNRLDELTELQAAVAGTNESAFYFQDLPAGFATAKSNSDGQFTMSVPTTGRFALAASASRRVIGNTEEYYWLVWESLEGKATKKVMLSNDNLTTSESSDSVLFVPSP
ncbi:MAG: hypothetical protein ACT4UQ_10505 [Gammaproteobacteria bacterium]